jgi:hypothetical protein
MYVRQTLPKLAKCGCVVRLLLLLLCCCRVPLTTHQDACVVDQQVEGPCSCTPLLRKR